MATLEHPPTADAAARGCRESDRAMWRRPRHEQGPLGTGQAARLAHPRHAAPPTRSRVGGFFVSRVMSCRPCPALRAPPSAVAPAPDNSTANDRQKSAGESAQALVAQRIEHRITDPGAGSSNLSGGTYVRDPTSPNWQGRRLLTAQVPVRVRASELTQAASRCVPCPRSSADRARDSGSRGRWFDPSRGHARSYARVVRGPSATRVTPVRVRLRPRSVIRCGVHRRRALAAQPLLITAACPVRHRGLRRRAACPG